jgi:hypothetical protein
MTVKSYPWQTHPLQSTAEWSDLATRFRQDGVIPIVDNQFQVYADSTGMKVKVKTGRAFLRGVYIINDAEATVTLASSNPTNPRIDVIVLRVDWVNETVTIGVVTGTPAASPSTPALTNNATYLEYMLAKVTVDAAVVTITAAKVEDGRVFSWAQAASTVGLILALS